MILAFQTPAEVEFADYSEIADLIVRSAALLAAPIVLVGSAEPVGGLYSISRGSLGSGL